MNLLPLEASYRFASFLADLCYIIKHSDRRSVIRNLKTIVRPVPDERTLRRMARELYRNFAKYLVDFFRFSRIDEEYVKKFVKVEGRHNIDSALAKGKGAVLVSAHIGNWELGGSVISLIGYPMSAVVLTHRNKKIDEFFKKQRLVGKLTPIQIGASLKECYKVLRSNRLLGLLGDRDFTKNGLMLDFFGKKTLFPKGPSALSYRLGAALIPTLIVREPDDTFRLTFEEPIYADSAKSEGPGALELASKCAAIIEGYVRRYPTQWYIFKDMWNKDE
ncbi:MAG: lysophospholipid acyltransferase family protein [Candidatus Omnitrophica bacterium]|nr:lysophospholipid acyltransferase family protein [Candidatus Omnitrophota bacterium]